MPSTRKKTLKGSSENLPWTRREQLTLLRFGAAPNRYAFVHLRSATFNFEQDAAFQTFEGSSSSSWRIYAQDTPKEERRLIDWDVFMQARAFDEVTFG